MFSAFGIVLVFEIRIRISWSDCSARNRRLFSMFNAPFVFLALALFKGFGRTWSNRCARCILEFLAFVLTLPLFETFISAANLEPLTRRAQSRIPDLCAYPYPVRKTRLVRNQALSKPALRSRPSGLCLFCHALVQTGSLKLAGEAPGAIEALALF